VATALNRVQEAWRSAEDFPGSGAGTQPPGRLMIRALEELDDCVDALRFAEQLLRAQNDAMEHLQQTIREERRRYQMLLEIVSDAVIMTDLQGIIRAVNPAAAHVLGRNPKYMLNRPLKKYAQHGRFPAPEQLLAAEDDLALGLRTRSGATVVTATASAIQNDRGIVIGLHWLCREVSA
jgi:PAS domain S-box-containing protein